MYKINADSRDGAPFCVITSWVLGYSSAPRRAVDEMLRVCVNSGVVAIDLTYEPGFGRGVGANYPAEEDIVGSMYGSIEELKALIGDKLDRIYFQQEPDSDGQKGRTDQIHSIVCHP